MTRSVFLFLACLIGISAFSQRTYFIYIQSENGKPFFVRMDDKYSSSSASGYINLAKIGDSTIRFGIGFPGNTSPEQQFSVAMQAKDHGFLLKDFAEKGWGLFDMQSMAVVMNTNTGASNAKMQQDVSSFTNLLSKASGDTSILYETKKPVVKMENTQPATTAVKEAPVKTAIVVNQQQPSKPEEKQQVATEAKSINPPATEATKFMGDVRQENAVNPAKEKAVSDRPVQVNETVTSVEGTYKLSAVTKRSESSTTEGFGLVFIDRLNDGREDTIRLLIANDQKYNLAPVQGTKKNSTVDSSSIVKEVKKEAAPTAESYKKSNCKTVAGESDFLNLRKNMAAMKNDDDMLDEARKLFKLKCYTTEQIRNLGLLFLSDYGKYQFFDAAFLHTSDTERFSSLETELKDEYFRKRFKAMVATN